MCAEPITLKNGTQVACRTCNLCRRNRLNDLVGRAIAEQSTASKSLAVTLTYAGDTVESVVLKYHDIQKMLYRLRSDGFKVRYIVAGEYGEAKARAHWHAILFFYGKSPTVPTDSRFDWKYWPHGFSYFQHPDAKGFAYVLKYALKRDPRQGSSKALSLSKKPPLGHDFFIYGLARDLVNRGLPLQSPEYAFAHITERNGVARRYWLKGRLLEMFAEQYCGLWFLKYRSDPPLSKFILEKWLDPVAPADHWGHARPMRLQAIETDEPQVLPHDLEQSRTRAIETSLFLADVPDRLQTAILVLHASRGHYLALYSDDSAEIYLEDEKPWLVRKDRGVTVRDQLLRIGLKRSVLLLVYRYLQQKWRLSSNATDHLLPPL